MTEDDIKSSIKKEEGLKLKIYYDTKGNPTGGYGHFFSKNSPLSLQVSELLFKEDYDRACSDYIKLKLQLDTVRRSVLIDMLFNMGYTRVLKFEQFLKALRNNDWQKAHDELTDSDYARDLVNRSERNAAKILTGQV